MKVNNCNFVCILFSVLGSSMCSVSEDAYNFQRDFSFHGLPLDQTPSSSELLGPSIDLDYTHMQEDSSGKQSHGISRDSQDFYNENDAARFRGRLGFFGSSAKQGASGHMSEQAYDGLQRRVHQDASDRNFYGGISGAHADSWFGGIYNGGHQLKQKSLAAAAIGSNGLHHKGHHSSGFHNSYHKDESGNNTSFYDDSADFGDHFFLGTQDGSYINQADELFGGNYHNGGFKDQIKGQKSNYGVSDEYDAASGHKQNYGHGRFYDNAAGYAEEEQAKNTEKAIFTGRNGGSGRYDGANINHEQLYGENLKPRFYSTSRVPKPRNSLSSEQRNYYPVHDRTYNLENGARRNYGDDNEESQYAKQFEPSVDKYYKPKTSTEIGYFGTYRGITY